MAAGPRGRVHKSGVWGLKLPKRVGPAARGSTEFGSLGPEVCEKGTPTRPALGKGTGATWKSSSGPRNCRKRKPKSTMNPGKRDSI